MPSMLASFLGWTGNMECMANSQASPSRDKPELYRDNDQPVMELTS
jgi:hypothetical protein